jgi:two-component system, chemotaxis family, protein-glutamate methylesterase/glutaminase
MNSLPIRVLLVDDSPLALNILSRLLTQDPDIQVVGKAQNGLEALHLIPLVKPTIICTDYFMPKMDGLELTKQVMQTSPMPILVVSSILDVKNSKEVFWVLQAGALDCIQKPTSFDNDATAKALVEKIRVLSRVYVMGKGSKQSAIPSFIVPKVQLTRSYQAIAIGASTGGPVTLAAILKDLPPQFPIPILCVQHISNGFLEGFAEWLKSQCRFNIKIIKDEEQMKPGHIYLPMEGTHLVVDHEKHLRISYAPPIGGHRPSINVTMESVALHFGKEAIGILLTGMGDDGAKGMKAISSAGGLTIAQSEASCAVFGMPQAAINIGAASLVMDPTAISAFLKEILKTKKE